MKTSYRSMYLLLNIFIYTSINHILLINACIYTYKKYSVYIDGLCTRTDIRREVRLGYTYNKPNLTSRRMSKCIYIGFSVAEDVIHAGKKRILHGLDAVYYTITTIFFKKM